MHPSGNGDDDYSTADRSSDNRNPLVSKQTKTLHQPHSGRDKEKAEVVHKKCRNTVDPLKAHYTEFQRQSKQQHTYDT
jgi:hypothetical protein